MLPFTYTAMLGWAAAAVIPVAIHFLSRRRYRETSWAAMQFLLAAAKKHARRLRIEQLLLLLVRVCMLLMLAIALADPTFDRPTGAAPGATGGRTLWVLVLDGSYSMDYLQGDRTLFAHAQNSAVQLGNAAQEGDGFSVVLMAEPPTVAIREPAFDLGDVQREINSLAVRHTGADLTASLREVKEIVESATRRHPRLEETHICIFSDVTRRTWEATEAEGCRKLISELSQKAQIHLMEVGERRWQNAVVTRLDAVQGTAIVDRDIQFVGEIRRLSADAPQQVRAEWLVNDKVVQEEQVDLTTGADLLTLSHRFSAPGEFQVELRIADADPLAVDNHRWRVVLVRDTIRALCVEGSPGAARYVAAALEPRETEHPLIRWEIVNESALVERDLAAYDCIFLCNVGRFSSEEAESLRRYVHAGGGLTIFLGDQVQPSDYNDKLGSAAGEQRILPAALGEVISAEARRFDPLEYKHPLVRPFAEHERAGLLTVPTWRYFHLDPVQPSAARTALAFDNGDAALVEERIGRGRVLVFASAATASSSSQTTDQSWTDLAVWPSFLPIVQQMVMTMVEGAAASRHSVVGEPLIGTMTAGQGKGNVLVTTPSGNPEHATLVGGSSAESRWRFTDVFQSGIYHVQLGDAPQSIHKYAVNVDTAEGQLDRYDPAQLPSQVLRGMGETVAEEPAITPYARKSFARWALAAVVGLLLLENCLAWHFGAARG